MPNPPKEPHRWRDRIPLAPWGWREVVGLGLPLLGTTVGLIWFGGNWAIAAIVPGVLIGFGLYFFRDPRRTIPGGPGLYVSPADGKVVEINQLDHDDFIGGPALRIGIFLSIFNVHINRAPVRSRVVELRYKPGEFLNAMNPESSERNESMTIGLEELDTEGHPVRRIIVRQISGLIARRIVCPLTVGDVIDRGERFGMIKFGSRTEFTIPNEEGLQIEVEIGNHVHGGSTVLARFEGTES